MENRTKTGVSTPSARNRAADAVGGAVADEDAVGAGAAGVHHALGDALMVEVGDLLPQVVVLQQGRAALPGLQRVVGVAEPQALRRGEERTLLGQVRRARRRAALRSASAGRPGLVGLGGSGPCGSVGSSSAGSSATAPQERGRHHHVHPTIPGLSGPLQATMCSVAFTTDPPMDPATRRGLAMTYLVL